MEDIGTINNSQNSNLNAKPFKGWVMIILFFYAVGFFMWFFFPVAGDWGWIEGWVYIISFSFITAIYYYFINKKNPLVLRNRLKLKKTGVTEKIKKEARSDRWIYPILGISFFMMLIIPGLDKRFGWTNMPLSLKIIGFFATNIGMILYNMATGQNPYASKVLDINKGQTLVDTGMYAVVRHPLYSGAIIMMIGTPFLLGSWYGIIPSIICMGTILFRIKYEEAMLIKEMDGYEEYRKRVKYKIIPKIF